MSTRPQASRVGESAQRLPLEERGPVEKRGWGARVGAAGGARGRGADRNHGADRVAFQTAVERIKLATPIEAVVQARVPELKRKGKLYWACCPFHDEKTPSFAVDPGRGTWRCFGACSEGGDSILFVQRFDGLSFWDALTLLANECGETLPSRGRGAQRPEEDARREQLFEVLDRAQRLFARALEEECGRAARAYLEQRGLSRDVVRSFGCGWAQARGNPLLRVATQAGFPHDLLIEAGLVKEAEDGRAFDFFRNRLMIPIRDRLGRTVGFGGRILPQEISAAPQPLGGAFPNGDPGSASGSAPGPEIFRGPKYVNTPDTRLFHKGRLIFGLDRAADSVRKRRHLVLVEGYTDVMAAHQAGLEHVAAVLGTATTPDHAALVRRSAAERVTLVFDGDAAGGRASEKALGELLPLGLHLDVVAPPEGQDPCDLLVRAGGAAFEALLEGAKDWFTWSLDGLQGLEGSDLAQGVETLFGLIARLERPVEEALRRRQLAEYLSIPEQAVEAQWERWRATDRRGVNRRAGHLRASDPRAEERRGETQQGEGRGPRMGTEAAPVDSREREVFGLLVGSLLLDNSLIPLYSELLERAPTGPERRIFEVILHLYEHGDETEPIDAGSVTTALGDDPARELVVSLELTASRADSPQALARDQELWLERRDHERELRGLRQRLLASQGSLTPFSEAPAPGPDRNLSDHSPGEQQTQEQLLRSLHAELKKRRVPSRAPSGEAPPDSLSEPQTPPSALGADGPPITRFRPDRP